MFAGSHRSLRSCFGKYLCSEPWGLRPHTLSWNRDQAKSCEQWEIIPQPGEQWALKSAHGLYMSAKPDGSAQRCSRTIGPNELFIIRPVLGGYVVKSSATGKCIAAHADGSITCDRDPVLGTKEIVVEILPVFEFRGNHQAFKLNGKFLSCEPDGSLTWNSDVSDQWEDFFVELEDIDLYSIKGWNDKYVSVFTSGQVMCTDDEVTPACLWRVESLGDSTFVITGANGNSLGVSDGVVACKSRERIGVVVEKPEKPRVRNQ